MSCCEDGRMHGSWRGRTVHHFRVDLRTWRGIAARARRRGRALGVLCSVMFRRAVDGNASGANEGLCCVARVCLSTRQAPDNGGKRAEAAEGPTRGCVLGRGHWAAQGEQREQMLDSLSWTGYRLAYTASTGPRRLLLKQHAAWNLNQRVFSTDLSFTLARRPSQPPPDCVLGLRTSTRRRARGSRAASCASSLNAPSRNRVT